MYIKRRVIDAELIRVISYPYVKKIKGNKAVASFRALVRITDTRAFLDQIDYSLYLVEAIAPPYTYPLWKYLYSKYKKEPLAQIDYIKLYGYAFKPNRNNIAFYICDATLRKISPKIRRKMTDSISYFNNRYNSYFEGEDYIRGRYPHIDNENNKIRALFFKKTTPKSILYYQDLTKPLPLYLFDDALAKLINPEDKEELKGKPIFYQLLNTLADSVSKEENINKGLAITKLLASNTFSTKAQKYKSTEAQD